MSLEWNLSDLHLKHTLGGNLRGSFRCIRTGVKADRAGDSRVNYKEPWQIRAFRRTDYSLLIYLSGQNDLYLTSFQTEVLGFLQLQALAGRRLYSLPHI